MNFSTKKINIESLFQLNITICEYLYHQILTLVDMNYIINVNNITIDDDFNIIHFEHKILDTSTDIDVWVCKIKFLTEFDLQREFKLKYIDIALSDKYKQNKEYIIGFLNDLNTYYHKLSTNIPEEYIKVSKKILKIGRYIYENDTYNYLLIKNFHINKNNRYVVTCQRSDSDIQTVVTFNNEKPNLIVDIDSYKKEFNKILLANAKLNELSAKRLKVIYQKYVYKHQLYTIDEPIFPNGLVYIKKDAYFREKILKTILNLKEHIK